jgi:hypothetical protein
MPQKRENRKRPTSCFDDEDETVVLDLGVENRRVCGDFTILKCMKQKGGVYKILTESGQIKEMTDCDIEEMINPNKLPQFCYVLPGYENRRRRGGGFIAGKRLSSWVQPHVMNLEGFSVLQDVECDSSSSSSSSSSRSSSCAPGQNNSNKKFNEWTGREDFSLPWKKRVMLLLFFPRAWIVVFDLICQVFY